MPINYLTKCITEKNVIFSLFAFGFLVHQFLKELKVLNFGKHV